MITNSKTMTEFWGHFLQITFHEGKTERWTVREKKAKWCLEHLKLRPESEVLELGCGDGIVDVWLSRFKCKVTAIDRLGSVLAHARADDDTKSVNFIKSDLQDLKFSNETYDGIFIFEALGLLKKEEDLKLLQDAFKWLKPGGRIAVDCPVSPNEKNIWENEFPSGKVHADTLFDKQTRIHKLNFNFFPKQGEAFSLKDASCSNHDATAGISRYIYPQDELKKILEKIGFKVEVVPHYYGESYYALIGKRPDSV